MPLCFAAALAWLGSACLVPPAHAACDPQLFCETTIPAGVNPRALVVGDFNADGIADLAVANGGGSVTVHFGRGTAGVGNGTFDPAVSYVVSGRPFSIVSGDFNADGIADLATANWSAHSVSVLLGQGVPGPADGTFAPPASYVAGLNPYSLTTGDFNEDGSLDLAVSNNNSCSGGVSTLPGLSEFGLADGTFASSAPYPLDCFPAGIATRDLDSDGILDLAILEHTQGTFAIKRGGGTSGVGNGTFGPTARYPTSVHPYDIRIADFDSDGILDLVSAGASGLTIARGLGSGGIGSGTFGPPTNLLTSSETTLEVGDFTRDGIPDLVSVSGVTNTLRVLRALTTGGVADGRFLLELQRSVGHVPIAAAAGDFDEDGRADLAIANYEGNSISILLNVGPTPQPPAAAGWVEDGASLCTAIGDQTNPQAVSDGAGGAIAVWQDRREAASVIYAQRVGDDGNVRWSANGIPICPDSLNHTQPRAAEDGRGGAWVAWLQPNESSAATVYLHRVGPDGLPDPGIPCPGRSVSAPGFIATDVALAPAGDGGVLVAYTGAADAASAALYCQRFDALGVAAAGWPTEGGVPVAEWTAPDPALDAAAFAAPDLSPDGAGGAAIAWRTRHDHAAGTQVYSGAARVTGAGTLLHGDAFRFEAEGDALGMAAGTGTRMIAAGSDGSEIVARRIGPSGAVEWALPLGTGAGERQLAALAPFPDGSACAVWTDERFGSRDLFASRVAFDGELAGGWPANGLAVSVASGDQAEPRALPASDMSLSLCWVDHRAGEADLYALRLGADGALRAGWPAGGAPICDAEGIQSRPVLAPGAAGGTIVIWQDGRSDNGDIYAHRIPGAGIVDVEPAPADLPGLRLSGARPNPARGVVWAAFSLPGEGPASLELYDLAGRRLLARDVGAMGAGSHLAGLEPASPLPAGLYVLRLRTPGRALSTRVVVTK